MQLRRLLGVGLLSLILVYGVLVPAPQVRAQSASVTSSPYRPTPLNDEAHRLLESYIAYQMEDKALPAFMIALVADQSIPWAKGFGLADSDARRPATEETVFRAASISKLFNAVAVMQAVEAGRLDLDAPISTYLPGFAFENPFDRSITLRQLLSHRAGVLREPPVGNYFDPAEPGLTATARSMEGRRIVYEPGTQTKYSNAGVTLSGYILETVLGTPYAELVQQAVLDPMGLGRSSFLPRPDLLDSLATGLMWSYHGRPFEAPGFELGLVPAANLYTTVTDLARFMHVLFAEGRGPNGPLLRPETLEQMWTPQFTNDEQGFGLGFYVSSFQGRRQVRHGGAIYGFASEFSALPDEKLGVVAVTTVDVSNPVVQQITDFALALMLAVREGTPLPDFTRTEPVDPSLARHLDGTYRNGDRRVDLVERNASLFLDFGASRYPVRTRNDTLVTDGRLGYGLTLNPTADAVTINETMYTRRSEVAPEPVAERLAGLIGEYGWDHNLLFIHEKEGRLHALIEWFFEYPLEALSDDEYAFPDYGLYSGERLIFTRDPSGKATQVEAAGVVFERRPVGSNDGQTFTIAPLYPIDTLRARALAASPPEEAGTFREPDLVDVTTLDSTLRLDVRYASTNNFMQAVFYDEPRVFLQRPAAEALVRAHKALNEKGYGLLLFDGYRPWYVTNMFWDATPDAQKHFVADPSQGSRHNRGCAIDLTLYDLETGAPIPMPSGYDEFSDRAFPDYPGTTERQRWHRELLRDAMEAEGFTVYEYEWWHFDYRDWRHYPITNLTFDALE